MKLLAFAPWQIDELIDVSKPGEGLLAVLLPPVVELRVRQGRFEQRVAFLRHVEALRMYAADHGGKLPTKLSDLAVPLPVDPFTGKSFAYDATSTTVRLRGGSPKSDPRTPGYNVTIQN